MTDDRGQRTESITSTFGIPCSMLTVRRRWIRYSLIQSLLFYRLPNSEFRIHKSVIRLSPMLHALRSFPTLPRLSLSKAAFRLPNSKICPLPSALCPLPSVLCPLSSALCPLPSVLCHLSSVLCLLFSDLCRLSSVSLIGSRKVAAGFIPAFRSRLILVHKSFNQAKAGGDNPRHYELKEI
jgi:hypothetical protein